MHLKIAFSQSQFSSLFHCVIRKKFFNGLQSTDKCPCTQKTTLKRQTILFQLFCTSKLQNKFKSIDFHRFHQTKKEQSLIMKTTIMQKQILNKIKDAMQSNKNRTKTSQDEQKTIFSALFSLLQFDYICNCFQKFKFSNKRQKEPTISY